MTKADQIIRKYTVVGIDERTGPFKEIKWKEVITELCSIAFEAAKNDCIGWLYEDCNDNLHVGSVAADRSKQQFLDSLFKETE